MPALTILSTEEISPARFGGKAAGLALLRRNGLPVPDALLVEACQDTEEWDGAFQARLKDALPLFPQKNGRHFVAVRSSCTEEDSYEASQAGRFHTVLGRMTPDETVQAAMRVVDSLRGSPSDARMGVVIQTAVDADYSGVLFSSDPFTYSKRSLLISYTAGTGEALVSGASSGWDVAVTDGVLPPEHGPMEGGLLLTLARQVKALETRLGYPVDVEWACKDGALFYLQCRPLAAITGVKSGLYPVTASALAGLPPGLVSHDKLRIRLAAQRAGALISNAWLLIRSGCANAAAPAPAPERSPLCSGYSAVILYPRHVAGKVVRSFVGDPSRAEEYLASHPGRQVCSSPKYETLEACLADYARLTQEDWWLTAVILQEIFQPQYTGVMQQVEGGCLAELTLGHFLTKGVVDTSQYVLDDAGHTLRRREARQESWFEIVEGHVLACRAERGRQVALSDDALGRLRAAFSPFLTDSRVVEFGVLPGDAPYLIDYVEEDPKAGVTAADLSTGILSRGWVTGALRRLREDVREGLDVHLYDAAEDGPRCGDAVIFLCRRPNIALLPLLDRYEPERIGFVFEDGSVLCHLAVVLRERGIPAVKLGEALPPLPEGALCVLDAEPSPLTGKERIHLV